MKKKHLKLENAALRLLTWETGTRTGHDAERLVGVLDGLDEASARVLGEEGPHGRLAEACLDVVAYSRKTVFPSVRVVERVRRALEACS